MVVVGIHDARPRDAAEKLVVGGGRAARLKSKDTPAKADDRRGLRRRLLHFNGSYASRVMLLLLGLPYYYLLNTVE